MAKREVTEKDLPKIGMIFGRLIAIHPVKGKYSPWEFLCICGEYTVVPWNNIIKGNTTSCGCSKKVRHRCKLH